MIATRRRKGHPTDEAQSEEGGGGAEAKVGCASDTGWEVVHLVIWGLAPLIQPGCLSARQAKVGLEPPSSGSHSMG